MRAKRSNSTEVLMEKDDSVSSTDVDDVYSTDLLTKLTNCDTVPLTRSIWEAKQKQKYSDENGSPHGDARESIIDDSLTVSASVITPESSVDTLSPMTPQLGVARITYSGRAKDTALLPTGLTTKQAAFKMVSSQRRLSILQYVPIGSLNFIPAVPEAEILEEWRETISPPDCLPETHPLMLPLGQLLSCSWIRIWTARHLRFPSLVTIRVYVLPDDRGLGTIPKEFRKHRAALRTLMENLDITKESWLRQAGLHHSRKVYKPGTVEDDSLFYLFNKIPSPRPTSLNMEDAYAKAAIDGLIQYPQQAISGLKAKLYPYQRRSAAMMIQREVKPARMLDPRLETLVGPNGDIFYFDRDACVVLKERREYEEATGGILAETMGYGKTLISLATILSTRGSWPRIPPVYLAELHPKRPQVGTLMQMAAATIGRSGIPWKPYFDRHADEGEDFTACIQHLKQYAGSYFIPGTKKRSTRNPDTGPNGQTIFLSSATLIIVPPNLVAQWLHELDLHIEKESLSVFVIEDLHQQLPPASELRTYDIILLSKPRFERESSSHDATLKSMEKEKQRKCACISGHCRCPARAPDYHSPLKDLHFLRLIVDEGHNFVSTGASGNAGNVLNSLHVERKWIVSGTPSSGLMGVEVDTASMETVENILVNSSERHQAALEARRKEVAIEQERKDLEKLGNIVVNFLHLAPWVNGKSHIDCASWRKYVMTSKSGLRNITSLKGTLEGLVVRHRIEDVEADLPLPPLYNRVVNLEPCYLDKLAINLFTLVLTTNAITSERVDQDYMFHASNRKQLDQLVRNLRQSGFYWTGFPVHEVSETIKNGHEYLNNPDKHVSEEDRSTLDTAINAGLACLRSLAWRAFSELAEMGLFVADFPDDARRAWSLCPQQVLQPLLIGATQLQLAQKHVIANLYAPNPAEGLSAAGIIVMEETRNTAETKDRVAAIKHESPGKSRPPSASGQAIPRSVTTGVHGVHKKSIRASAGVLQDVKNPSPTKPKEMLSKGLKSALKSTATSISANFAPLPPGSPLMRTRLIGTASAKLSYLLDQVHMFQKEEKIIIFYEGDHIAWYIAQCLELIHVQHLIYAKGTTLSLRAAYLELFASSEKYRVLLMDIRQAAHGLNVASASRIFFVNPVWQPSIEAQAIKRAHRIGQSRPVFVETLVLKGTFEEQLYRRRKTMTAEEHQQAAKSLLDDSIMNDIIKNLTFIPVSDQEVGDQTKQMGPLHFPQPVFEHDSSNRIQNLEMSRSENLNTATSGPVPQGLKRKAMFADHPGSLSDASEARFPMRRKAGVGFAIAEESGIVRPVKT